jgi:3-hydroxyacyl-CoA dehydrogenase/enoyl-CoA hydratase/3-hydroxybutyryl-CoA epimerase
MSVFRIEPSRDEIVHLVMDDASRKINVIDEGALADLEASLERLESGPERAGVVVRSGKPGSFVAGADVHAIAAITDREQVLAIVRRAHAAFNRLAGLPFPTVAAIDGVCLGGGTELALACDSRIASDEPHTQIGLPEVLLGIIPGFGGTTRLPRLVGVSAALDLILTGRALDARRAERMGLISKAVPAAWLIENAERRVLDMKSRGAGRRDRFRPRSMSARLLDGTAVGQAIVFNRARSMTKARTGGHYPAPIAAISVMERGLGKPLETGFGLEEQWVADLVTGPVCKNLIRIFMLSEHAKKGVLAPDADMPSKPIHRISLLGAGVMGGGIAELASRQGIAVRMRDVAAAPLTKALLTTKSLIDERLRRRKGPREARARDRDAQLARIEPTLELTGLGRADAVIEAVVEDLDIKRRVLAEAEVRTRPDALIASNTSSLSIDTLATGLKRPARFCGFHFFNPVHRMPLVEIVRGRQTSGETLATAIQLARRLGKTPVVVADAPGFVVNRVLMPYLREAMHLLEEGFPLPEIDGAMREFGMPMGPFEVLDEVGLDVAAKVAGILSRAFPDRMESSPAMEKLVSMGRLGRKSGAGFYRHVGSKRILDPELGRILAINRNRAGFPHDGLRERMVLLMINESARCIEEGVATDAGSVDLAMVFGAGFPPFRGGPLRHADSLGLPTVESRLSGLRAEKGQRFAPCALIVELARQGGSFSSPALRPAAGTPTEAVAS